MLRCWNRASQLAAASVLALVLGCFGGDELDPACLAATEWSPLAQEFYFESNEQDRSFDAWLTAMTADFNRMATLTLPPASGAPESELLPLLHDHNVAVERFISALASRQTSEIEPTRLAMNDVIRRINGLLVAECELTELTLYQPRPADDRAARSS